MTENQRTRQREIQQGSGTPDGGAAPDDTLANMRADADRILNIADRAFERIRSTDSQEHLRRHRQRGGQ